jgi:hypothetical protein
VLDRDCWQPLGAVLVGILDRIAEGMEATP